MGNNHVWKFFRAGGFDQVRLESGADLMALDQLDQKLWVALACPTTGLEFDAKTLALVDTDKDGRIRAPELLEAIRWTGRRLKRADDLLKGSAELPLAALNDATPEGKQLLSAARHILGNLGKKDASVITLEDTADTARIFAQTHFNGDGIVPADAAEDAAVRGVIQDIIACLGAELDRSGKPGVSQAKVDQFFAEAQAYSDWWAQAEKDSSILPLNGATLPAAAAFRTVKAKVEDYFMRCRLAAFDPRAVNALNRDEKDYLVIGGKELSPGSSEIASLPLAQVGPGKPLSLRDGLNPAWAGAMARFESLIVRPFLDGATQLSEADWAVISAKFAAYESWLGRKTGGAVEPLGLARVREILGAPSKAAISALIAEDKALEPEANATAAVERLIRYHRDLCKLINNFVCFRDFYSRKDKAIFQAGTLYLDQRSCELCLPVADPGRHALLAALAGAYLAYCDCVRTATGEKMQIVAAFTDGDSDNLMVGRNGVFYDRKGRDWDATITKIIDNPISIRQAFWAPYKKLVRMIEEQIAKRAAAADAQATSDLDAVAAQVANAEKLAKPVKPGEPRKFDVGVVAALGVAVGAIGGALASLATGLARLEAWQLPLVVAGVMLLISGPSMLIAFLKLRKRNLGPILDANGWAVNSKAKINVPFGGSLTGVAVLPPGSHRDMVDPFAEKKRPWALYWTLAVIAFLAFGWLLGKFDEFLPEKATRAYIIKGKRAPVVVPPTHSAAPATPAPAEQPK